ncbi:MAG: phosphoglycerate kinase [Acidilobus sp.]
MGDRSFKFLIWVGREGPGARALIEVGGLRVPTLDDLSPKGMKVLLRIDVNSPVDSEGRLLDDSRIRAHAPTVRELLDMGNAVVMISHQGRPGDRDFISLDQHASLMSKYVGQEVRFIDDVAGPCAREAIRSLRPGEALMLDNVRLYAEEVTEGPPEAQANTHLVRRLAPLFNAYVNDAFATAHRSQPSLVGFPLALPSAAGRVMERELTALSRLFNPDDSPKVFVLGGGKVNDTLRIIANLAQRRVAERILTGGLVAEVFAVAKGIDIGRRNLEVLERLGLMSLVPRARRLVMSGVPVEVPIDYVTEEDGNVKEEPSSRVSGVIKDIGPATREFYSSLIREAKVVVLRGPMGVIEDPRFREGSVSVLRSAVEGSGFVIIGGGHMASMAGLAGELPGNKVHVSTGGGAMLVFLSGEPLPAVEALAKGVRAK